MGVKEFQIILLTRGKTMVLKRGGGGKRSIESGALPRGCRGNLKTLKGAEGLWKPSQEEVTSERLDNRHENHRKD